MDNTHLYIVILVIAFLGSIFLEMMILPRIIYIAKKKRLFDLPDARKKHCMPIPRLGGITFMPIILLVSLFSIFIRYKLDLWSESFLESTFPEFLLFICGLTIIYLLGAKDDLVGVGFKKKFLIQFLASLFIVGSGTYVNNFYGLFGIHEIPNIVGMVLSIIIVIYTTNAINLIDGADGLASGLSAVALMIFGVIFCRFGMWTYATVAFMTLGILIPFFYYNFFHPTRKIFMGDTGSLTLGYILGFMMIRLMRYPLPEEIIPSGFMLLVLSALYIPLFDAVRVMLVRMLTGRPPFSPDRNHIHHKIIDLGFSRKKTVGIIVISSVILFLINLGLLFFLNCNIVLVIDLAISIGLSYLLYGLTKMKVEKQKVYEVQQEAAK